MTDRSTFARDYSARSVLVVCRLCGARDVSTTDRTADRWIASHLEVCQVTRKERERDRITAALRDRARRR